LPPDISLLDICPMPEIGSLGMGVWGRFVLRKMSFRANCPGPVFRWEVDV